MNWGKTIIGRSSTTPIFFLKNKFFRQNDFLIFNFNVESFATIRSKPQRTYDPLRETQSPDGSDMPMVLMNMLQNNKKQWETLQSQLVEFGKDSGLFADLEVKTMGGSSSHPFQLRIQGSWYRF